MRVRWDEGGILKASHGALSQRHDTRSHKGGAWLRARGALNFVDFFIDYIIANARQTRKQQWQKARAQLRTAPQPSTVQAIPPPLRIPQATVPRRRPVSTKRPSRSTPSIEPATRRPPLRLAVQKPIRRLSPAVVRRPQPRPALRLAPTQPRRLARAITTTARPPLRRPSAFGLRLDLGGVIALPGHAGMGTGLGTTLAVSWHGWRLTGMFLFHYHFPGNEGTALLLQPALLLGIPFLKAGELFHFSVNLGLGAELFQLAADDDIVPAWQPRLGGVFEAIGLFHFHPSWALSVRTLLHLSDRWIEQTHGQYSLSIPQWTLSIRLGLHWRIL